MSRTLPSFSKHSYDAEDYEYDLKEELSPLIKQFAKNHIPTVVDSARARNANSIIQQVNSILNGKSRYATVADAVQDMTERTGLGAYLETVKSAEEAKKKDVNKQASEFTHETQVPSTLSQYDFADKVVSYIKNNIKNSNGLSVTIPQLQADILDLFGRQGIQPQDVMNDEFVKYLSDCIFEAQSGLPPEHHNSNIGFGVGKDLEDSNDAWSGLMPSK